MKHFQMKRPLMLLSAFLILAIVGSSSAQTEKATNPLPKKTLVNSLVPDKKLAPAFDLTSLNGKKLESVALRGKIVVFNFWFTGCVPCVAEMPELNKLVEKYKDDVVFIAPALETESVLRTFLVKHPFKYEIVPSAGDLIINTYSDGTDTVAFPVSIIIDREGNIDTRITGSLLKSNGNAKELKNLEDAIKRLIQKNEIETIDRN